MNTESGPENPADLFSLDGRVALITGGNGGFGRHLASRFAAAGASVVIADIDIEGTADVIAIAPIPIVTTAISAGRFELSPSIQRWDSSS